MLLPSLLNTGTFLGLDGRSALSGPSGLANLSSRLFALLPRQHHSKQRPRVSTSQLQIGNPPILLALGQKEEANIGFCKSSW